MVAAGTFRGVRYALNIPPFTDPAVILGLARDAEAAGWDAVFLWDHLQWSTTSRPQVHDPWVLLGAIAAETERVRIGTLVTPLTRRRLQIVAKHLLTLDHLSGGRVTFGIGLGEPAVGDFSAFGDEADPKVRGAMLDEGLAVLDQLLRGIDVDHEGAHYTAQGRLNPGPVQQPRPPIWVAGVIPNQRPVQRARRYEGIVPIGRHDEPVGPEVIADYLGDDLPAGWDVVWPWFDDVPVDEYADAGVTWLVTSTSPLDDDWVVSLRDRIRQGPGDSA
jgi:alkanesulfonate monooxygenase SsuD/methylene tetrahydromethanopterin reductase-like flavin-dependent oxidoreductase (luciferase family)